MNQLSSPTKLLLYSTTQTTLTSADLSLHCPPSLAGCGFQESHFSGGSSDSELPDAMAFYQDSCPLLKVCMSGKLRHKETNNSSL